VRVRESCLRFLKARLIELIGIADVGQGDMKMYTRRLTN
jgi:hypothetical protein